MNLVSFLTVCTVIGERKKTLLSGVFYLYWYKTDETLTTFNEKRYNKSTTRKWENNIGRTSDYGSRNETLTIKRNGR